MTFSTIPWLDILVEVELLGLKVYTFKISIELPNCPFLSLHPWIIPPWQRRVLFSLFCLLNFCQFAKQNVSYCCFNLHFSNQNSHRTSFHILTRHLYFFCEFSFPYLLPIQLLGCWPLFVDLQELFIYCESLQPGQIIPLSSSTQGQLAGGLHSILLPPLWVSKIPPLVWEAGECPEPCEKGRHYQG